MDRKIVLALVAVTLIAIAVAIVMPGGRQVDRNPKLPWLISVDTVGDSSVFGLTLTRSTLRDAEMSFSSPATLSLFRSAEGHHAVEAYFDRLYLSGLKANIVLSLKVEPQEAEAIFSRGSRISQLGDGTKKVEINKEDKQRLAGAPIDLITYLPAADLETTLLEQRFGIPAQQIAESDKLVHWLYPEKGLDITVNREGKEVFQYISPREFERILQPLKALDH